MDHALQRIRVISEGRAGHENQSAGLAAAIARRTGATVETARIPANGGLAARCRAAVGGPRIAPPELVIGAGHKVHLPLWFAARKFHAKSVVVMKPTWPVWLFDLCLAPRHDFDSDTLPGRIIPTRGALNRVPEVRPPKQPRGVVLIGGPSNQHGWAGEPLAAAIQEILSARTELTWTIADSRRTPKKFLETLREAKLGAELVPHTQTTSDWLPGQLVLAEEIWVTEDSVSMVFEAVTAGARTGLLPAPILKPKADPVRSIRELVRDGYATPFDVWRNAGRRLPPPKPLHETGRCADLVLQRLFPLPRA